MGANHLPSELEAPGRWQDAAPDPDTRPEYYQGVVLKRVVAYLVDVVIIAGLIAVAWIVFGLLGILSFGLLIPVLWPILALIPLAYHTVLIGGEASATIGMRLFKIEVRTLDGGRPDYLQAGLQTLAFYVSVALTTWLILLVVLFNKHRRALHDYLCGTVVINSLDWQPLSARRT